MVPFEENKNRFEKELTAKIIIEHRRGHFSGSDGVAELPSALDAIFPPKADPPLAEKISE